ncbi:alpha/beta fold hydrolase [Nocardia sp. NPDC057227]|uniref:alpha/beta fold hydrolase n=1 Tax=Nocardia sp. NPDC057227 TaxID=3346056 RepID=UPI0036367EA5
MTADQAAPVERMVRNGAVDLAVYESGTSNRDTVVLVHGWPDAHQLWDAVAERLAIRFHVVTYDCRGHGGSSKPTAYGAYRVADYAADLLAVIDAVSPDKPVHLMAHDWGALTAWDVVCDPQAQQRITAFLPMSGFNIDQLALWVRARLVRPTPTGLVQVLAQMLCFAYQPVFALPGIPWLVRQLGRLGVSAPLYRLLLRVSDGIATDRVTLAPDFGMDAANGIRLYRANALPVRLFRARRRPTAVPVRLIIPRRDLLIRRAALEDVGRIAPRLSMRVIATGHWAPYSHPELLVDVLCEFVDSLEPTTRSSARAPEPVAPSPEAAGPVGDVAGRDMRSAGS